MTDLLSVVDEVGTPVYVYDLARLRANQQRTRAALPARAGLYYALSANPHPELLREIRAGGALAEVRSPGELDTALVAGWPARDVLYTGPGRRDEDVDWALRLGVRAFTVDSPAMFARLDQLAAARGVVVSCLPRIDAGTGSPVGVDAGRVLTSPAGFASRANARVVGLRLCFAEDDLAERVAEAVRATCALATALHVRVESLDLCGFDVPLPALAGLRTRLTELLAGEPTRLMFEAGRQLVGSAGTLVTAVLDVREVPGGQVVVLESGANHVGPFAGGRRRSLVPRLLSRTADPAELLGTTVVGPLEIPLDVWAPSVPLPRLRPGDLMAVPDVGAAGPTAGLLAYASPAPPVEVVVDEDDQDNGITHVSRLAVTRYPDGR